MAAPPISAFKRPFYLKLISQFDPKEWESTLGLSVANNMVHKGVPIKVIACVTAFLIAPILTSLSQNGYEWVRSSLVEVSKICKFLYVLGGKIFKR